MRLKWTIPVALAPVALYACGTQLTIPPDSDIDGDGASAETSAEAAADGLGADAETVCTPTSCAAINAQCGSAPNGCGGTLADCGVCSGGELCGAGGPNRCGDGGCDAGSCGAGRCGNISNGCGGTLDCGGCAGTSYCVDDGGTCEACTFQGAGCVNVGGTTCPSHPNEINNAYACGQTPMDSRCVHCTNPNTGKGLIYCCP